APRDFGLLAMVFTVISVLQVFKDAGLSMATVQREGITHAQVSNLFWVNVAVSGFAGVLVAVSAPVLSWFYHEPRLVGITLALSPNFLLAGLAVQHMALLNRQMRFKAIAVIQVGAALAGVLVGLGMAWLKCGYWSLVGLNLGTSVVSLLMTWSASSWRPQMFTPCSGTRSLLHFGANLTAASLFNFLSRGMDTILIGRCYGAVAVGLYSRGTGMLLNPMIQFMNPISTVFVPAFSRLQSQPERYRRSFIQFFEILALTSFLFSGMFFVLARPLTLVVLGQKWEKASIIFAAFSITALQIPLTICISWLFTTQGRTKDLFHWSMLSAFMTVGSYIAGLPYGPAGVAIAFSCTVMLIQVPIYYWLAGRKGPVSSRDLWSAFLKHLPVWIIVTSVAWLARAALPDFSPLAQLVICVPASLLAGAAFILLYPPSHRATVNSLSILRELKSPRIFNEDSSEIVRGSAWAARSVKMATLGKFLFRLFYRLSWSLWKRLPPSVGAFRIVFLYGDFIHRFIRKNGSRTQVHGTFFLRNRPQLELIRRLVDKRRKGDTLRVAVLGCSTGPEAYSVAWRIRSARPDLGLVLTAVDISALAIETAELGVYSLSPSKLGGTAVCEKLTAREMDEFFDRNGDTVAVKGWIKRGINWRVEDVRDRNITESIMFQDLVVANNFLCHMSPPNATSCLRNIARVVSPGGYLFVSGIDLDVRAEVARDLGWEPVAELLEEIHDGDILRKDWPFYYYGLEPLDKRKNNWKFRYATAFQIPKKLEASPNRSAASAVTLPLP
ncbi:MAG TPA: oligosaccharide flippase family protein, partial [Verrucomicrobiae bacterium]|nr:oligosaccharide flippase family protein [Verrucomicrobiae bacterium]